MEKIGQLRKKKLAERGNFNKKIYITFSNDFRFVSKTLVFDTEKFL
jgi:hypothetical protein